MKLLSKTIFEETRQKINSYNIYEKSEVQNIVFLLLEHYFDLNKTAILADKHFHTSKEIFQNFSESVERVSKEEPIQYILGYTFFYGEKFEVNQSVLIPRPETEELVNLVLKENITPAPITKPSNKKDSLQILDIGTGSACIAITLSKNLSNSEVFALDISEDALKLAQENAETLKAKVQFIQADILNFEGDFSKQLDIIVSNPPYVRMNEKELMQKNVLDYEPHVALFVENENPLLFYEKITAFAKKNLKKEGKLYFEINEKYGKEVANLLIQNHFKDVNIQQDIFGKDRIVKGILED